MSGNDQDVCMLSSSFGYFALQFFSILPFYPIDDPHFWDRVLLSQRSPQKSKPPVFLPPQITSSTAKNKPSKISAMALNAMATSTVVTRSAAHTEGEGPKHKKIRRSVD